MLTKTMRNQVQYLSVGEVKIFIRLDLTLLPSLYLDESNGGCRQIILNDFLMENEVREKQLLGVNLGKLLSHCSNCDYDVISGDGLRHPPHLRPPETTSDDQALELRG